MILNEDYFDDLEISDEDIGEPDYTEDVITAQQFIN